MRPSPMICSSNRGAGFPRNEAVGVVGGLDPTLLVVGVERFRTSHVSTPATTQAGAPFEIKVLALGESFNTTDASFC